MRRRRFLEIFAGAGILSAAFRARGWTTIEWDIKQGKHFDLCSTKPLRQCLAEARRAQWVHLATPCSSFSTARRGHPGSPGGPLRSRAHPLGLPGLAPGDAAKVAVGNLLARRTAQVIRFCRKRGIPVSLENPTSSRLWIHPAVRRLLPTAVVSRADFCQFGTSWRKQTTFVSWGSAALVSFGAVCSGPRGLCSRTQKPHTVLSGNAPSGRPWTQVAEPYPRRLCASFAQAVDKAQDIKQFRYLYMQPEAS